jgi:hypothetical protein
VLILRSRAGPREQAGSIARPLQGVDGAPVGGGRQAAFRSRCLLWLSVKASRALLPPWLACLRSSTAIVLWCPRLVRRCGPRAYCSQARSRSDHPGRSNLASVPPVAAAAREPGAPSGPGAPLGRSLPYLPGTGGRERGRTRISSRGWECGGQPFPGRACQANHRRPSPSVGLDQPAPEQGAHAGVGTNRKVARAKRWLAADSAAECFHAFRARVAPHSSVKDSEG